MISELHKELLTKTASFYVCMMLYFDGFDVRADDIVDMLMNDKDNTTTRNEIMQSIKDKHLEMNDTWGFGGLFRLMGQDV